MCKDGKSVRDIFWKHPESTKLFNMFSIVLIIDAIYKTIHSLLETFGVPSTKMTYFVGFVYFGM